MKEILLSICNELGYVSAKNLSGITLEMVIEIVSEQKNIVEEIRLRTGCAKQTVTNFLKKTFPDRDPIKDKNLYVFLLAKKELKFCSRCNCIYPFSEFYTNLAKTKHGIADYCKTCSKLYRKETYAKDPQKEIQQNLIRTRLKNKLQTPKWADLEKIKEFYRNRPEGYHVDHIIPLNGENVCGLHVLENLQYLPASENLAKNNKY